MLDASLTILVIETWAREPLSTHESTSLSPASAGAEITSTSTLESRQGTPAGVDLGLVNMAENGRNNDDNDDHDRDQSVGMQWNFKKSKDWDFGAAGKGAVNNNHRKQKDKDKDKDYNSN